MPNNENVIKFFEDVKDAFQKAIGTSSSVNEERDERSVENYVRTGGNTMENTTEPDPKGDLAVNKVISGATAPEGNESVSDAPNNPGIVPNNETSPSSATSAIAPSKTDEVNTPDTVTIAKGEKCPTCGAIAKGDDTEAEAPIEKAADAESKEEDANETAADEKAEMKKSLWGGMFAPVK